MFRNGCDIDRFNRRVTCSSGKDSQNSGKMHLEIKDCTSHNPITKEHFTALFTKRLFHKVLNKCYCQNIII